MSESKEQDVQDLNKSAITGNDEMETIKKLDQRFGWIAVHNKLISLSEFKKATEKQTSHLQETGQIILIGDILVDDGSMSVQHRDAILKRQNRLVRTKKKHKSFAPSLAPLARAGVVLLAVR